MVEIDFENLESNDIQENEKDAKDVNMDLDEMESSFTYHAVPLDTQITLDENGTPFSLQELINIRELRDEISEKK